MEILIDIRLLGKGGQTGVEEYTRQAINHLLRLPSPHRFHLFYNGWDKIPLPAEWLNSGNAEVIDWQIPNRLFDLWQPALDTAFNDGPDLVYSPHLNYLTTARAPRLLTIHDLSFLHYPYFFNWRQRLWHNWQKIKEQAELAAAIVVDSAYTKNDVGETLKIAPEKIHTIYPGIDKEIYRVRKMERPANLEFPFILYLGTIEPRKNVGAIIEAFQILKQQPIFDDLKLIIAGKNSDTLNPKPYTLNPSDIIWWGKATAEEKIMLYNLAEVFVYPSFFEGFGFPPLEAQACGCPVVASNRASLKEILGSSALLIDPWKYKELALAIESILTNSNLRTQLIAKGLNNARQFNWQETACALLKLFSQLVS